MSNNIVVVGGGTAGWFTAIMLNYHFKSYKITVIESSEIGVIGAGEGTTPVFVNMLYDAGITLEDLIKNTSSTVKNGNRFVGFNDEKDYYYVFNTEHKPMQNHGIDSLYPLMAYRNRLDRSEYELIEQCTYENKVKFTDHNSANYAIHMDGKAISAYFKQVGQSRGIDVIDGIVTDLETDDENNIKSIILEDGKKIESGFVFDCTGFKRLIIGKHYGSELLDYSKNLPADTAIPFFIDIDGEMPPYVQIKAMNHGWTWKMLLQHRQGCGYVFDSRFATEEEIKAEIELDLGFVPEYQKTIKFKPETYKEIFIKNCVALGLASSFIEPMESTSIPRMAATVRDLIDIFKYYGFNPPQDVVDTFNKDSVAYMEAVVDFIYLHYMTNKTNTPFWKDFTKKNEMPEKLKRDLEHLNNFEADKCNFKLYGAYGYYRILEGNGILDYSKLEKWYIDNNIERFEEEFNEYRVKYMAKIDQFEKHSDFIKRVLDNE